MSDHTTPFPPSAPVPGFAAPGREKVALGLLGASAAALVGVLLTVVLWRAGFIAGITSFAIAAGAAFLYTKAAGAPPRRGLLLLLVVIILGVFLSFFAAVASDLWDAYDQFQLDGMESRSEFIRDNLFRGEVLQNYGKDAAFFGLFAVLGIYGTIKRLVASAS